jgi:hypothetical protein
MSDPLNIRLDRSTLNYLRDPKNKMIGLEPAVREQILSETEWTEIERPALLSDEQIEAVGSGKLKCPKCGGTKEYAVLRRGETTGLITRWRIECNCRDFKRFFTRWNAMIPLAYRKFRLNSLQPSPRSNAALELQAYVIGQLKANPDRSCLFVGPPATGKTVYSTCLFERALKRWAMTSEPGIPESCWYISAFDLLQQAHDYAIQRETISADTDDIHDVREAREPLVTVGKIRKAVKAGLKPRLYIEELDKIPTVTEFRGSIIFELIKEIDAQAGQIVITANKSADDLARMYAIRDGNALVRRFTKGNATGDGMTFDLFSVCAPLA